MTKPYVRTLLIAAVGACLPVVLSAQAVSQSSTATPAVPVMDSARGAPASGWSVRFSADYFKFESEWGGIQRIRDFYGANYNYPEQKRKGDIYGGTVTLGKNRWSFDFQYHTGEDSLRLPNNDVRPGGRRYVDIVDFDEKSYSANLRYTIGGKFYVSAGAYQTKLDLKYSYMEVTAAGAPVGPTGDNLAVRPSSSEQTFGSLGLGFAGSYPVGTSGRWLFAPKVELLGLYGSETGSSGNPVGSPNLVGQNDTTLFGYEATGTLQLACAVSNTTTLAVEGGYRIRGFGAEKASVSDQKGLFAKVSIRFAF